MSTAKTHAPVLLVANAGRRRVLVVDAHRQAARRSGARAGTPDLTRVA